MNSPILTLPTNVQKIAPHANAFLRPLCEITRPPEALRYLGSLPDERCPAVAIVGSRKPTSYGEEMAYRFAFDLAEQGVVIISGLALGIDAIAHRAALDAGGTAVAVLGNGLPTIYPSRNYVLAQRILSCRGDGRGARHACQGAILSEYPQNYPALPHNFLERNRLVAGLADAVLVVEAAERSGTLSTAAHALEQGRSVFALPGRIDAPLSAGCNNLLRQGASPALAPDDILRDIGASRFLSQNLTKSSAPARKRPSVEPESLIFAQLEAGFTDGDEIMQSLNLATADFAVAMTMLEIGGYVLSLGANRWAIK